MATYFLQAHDTSHLKTKARKAACKRIKEDKSSKIAAAAEVICPQVRGEKPRSRF